ncbi:Potato inhibitor I family protein [Nitzschia inconspicua]|uniref:Potato inhibitor I family protein n=1 Tax=Nitzschia inconspicua TaxID=303405 RepID=A0A9K3PDC7_9STRA|nr:Potato inhibitor I family protein [Nitzschia inconspicua]
MDNHPLQTLSKGPTADKEEIDLEEQQDQKQQRNKSSSMWSRTRSSFLRTLSGNSGEEVQEDAETPNNKADDDATVDSEQVETEQNTNNTPPTVAVPQPVRKSFFPVLVVLLLLLLSLVVLGLAAGLTVGKQKVQPSQVALGSNDGSNSSFMDEAVVTNPSLDRFHNGQPWSQHDRDVYGNVASSSAQHQEDKTSTNPAETPLPLDTVETAGTTTTPQDDDCFPPLEPMKDLTQFPCLVGMEGHEAQLTLEEAYPSLDVYVLHIDSPVTMDLRWDRVRIFVDDLGMVATIPYIG